MILNMFLQFKINSHGHTSLLMSSTLNVLHAKVSSSRIKSNQSTFIIKALNNRLKRLSAASQIP